MALLIWRNAIRSAVEEAALSAIGKETKASLRRLSQGSNSCGYPHKPFVSYRINRQLSGWIPPPLMICAFGRTANARHSRRENSRVLAVPTVGRSLLVH